MTLPCRRHISVAPGARGEVLKKQAKCHDIPDFRKKQTERFSWVWTTGHECALATSGPACQPLASLAVPDTFRILAFARESDYARVHSRMLIRPKES